MAAFIENMLIGITYIGVEVFSVNNEEKVAFLQLQKKKNELVASRIDLFDDREKLRVVKSKYPVALVINNEHVLQKEVQGTDADDRKLLNKAFPNVQANDFYYEIWRKEHTSVVAICRKSYADELLVSLEDILRVGILSLGIISISSLTSFELPQVLSTNTQGISLNDDGTIITGFVASEVYNINGLDIPNTHLLSFSGALQYLMPTTSSGSIINLNGTLTEKFKQKTFFEKGMMMCITALLILLVINFVLFSYFFDKATVMEETVSLNRAGIENVAKLKSRLKVKEQKLESFANNSSSGSSVIINDIVKNIPASLLLDGIVYHPLEKKVKEEEPIITLDNLIIVSGSTLSNDAFTSWVAGIEKLKKVEKVTITSFGKTEGSASAFSLKIVVKK